MPIYQDFRDKLAAQQIALGSPISALYPENKELFNAHYEKLYLNLPVNYELDKNFQRHKRFSEVTDWIDIYHSDIPRELKSLEEYKHRLHIIKKLQDFHPRIASVMDSLLVAEFDAALMKAFKGLEVAIKNKSGLKDTWGQNLVKQAFAGTTPKLMYKEPRKQEHVKGYIAALVSFYRNDLAHNELPDEQANADYAFKLLCLVDEALKMVDDCSINVNLNAESGHSILE